MTFSAAPGAREVTSKWVEHLKSVQPADLAQAPLARKGLTLKALVCWLGGCGPRGGLDSGGEF